jgi:YgiT-type zinc finger domain-containing protein
VSGPQANRTKIIFCETCGSATQATHVDVTLRSGADLVLIENVPARVCGNCQEQYYDEKTSQKISKLVGNGFPKRYVVREIAVPVYSLEGVLEDG